jgi:hypothetical protein
MQHVYLLQASWLCLVLPIGGLVYMTRAWLFAQDQNMPWIALAMVWLLLIAYSMFGLIPTAVYSFYRRDLIQKLPWMLDLLNLLAKFPVPILILIAFSTRPSGFHTCSASS